MRRFRTAVVIIHGFTGKLLDNEYLMNYLELNRRFDVYAKTLPGHYKDRFSDAKVEDWKKDVDHQIETLLNNGYKKIYVVGHSMGGVLTCYLASKYKEIKKIVLINAAFSSLSNTKQSDDNGIDFYKYKQLFEKILKTSPNIYFEFTKLVKEGSKYLKDINCDVLILRSLRDEIVSKETADMIYENIDVKNKWLTDVKNAKHTLLASIRKEDASAYIEKFLQGGRKWKKSVVKEI